MTLNPAMMEAVLQYRPRPELRVNGLTPLFMAFCAGDEGEVRLLLDTGVDASVLTRQRASIAFQGLRNTRNPHTRHTRFGDKKIIAKSGIDRYHALKIRFRPEGETAFLAVGLTGGQCPVGCHHPTGRG